MAAVLVELQQRLIDDYGDGAAARTLIDQVIAAYHDFIRLTGWIAHLSLTVEQELFGDKGGSAWRLADVVHTNDAGIAESGVKRHLVQLRECLLPLVERRGALMHETLAALEVFQAGRRKTTAVLEPMSAERDQLPRRQLAASSQGEIGAQPIHTRNVSADHSPRSQDRD